MRFENINGIECKVFEKCDALLIESEPRILWWTKLRGRKTGSPPWDFWLFVDSVNIHDGGFTNFRIWLEYKVYECAVPLDATVIDGVVSSTGRDLRVPFDRNRKPYTKSFTTDPPENSYWYNAV